MLGVIMAGRITSPAYLNSDTFSKSDNYGAGAELVRYIGLFFHDWRCAFLCFIGKKQGACRNIASA
jgi:hypothetical protein